MSKDSCDAVETWMKSCENEVKSSFDDLFGQIRTIEERNRIKIGFLGSISCGKSLTISALLGSGVLDVKNVATTYSQTAIRHSLDDSSTLIDENGEVLATTISEIREKLASAHSGAQRNVSERVEHILSTPIQFLEDLGEESKHVEILDWPGFNEAKYCQDDWRGDSVQEYVKKLFKSVDIVINVLNYSQLDVGDDQRALQELYRYRHDILHASGQRLFFLVNKIDQRGFRDSSVEETRTHVKSMIESYFNDVVIDKDSIICVSAANAELARDIKKKQLSQDGIDWCLDRYNLDDEDELFQEKFSERLYRKSGFQRFENELKGFARSWDAILLSSKRNQLIEVVNAALKTLEKAKKKYNNTLEKEQTSLVETVQLCNKFMEIENALKIFAQQILNLSESGESEISDRISAVDLMRNVDKTHFRTENEAREAAKRYENSCHATMKSDLLTQVQSTNKKLQSQINSKLKEFDSQLTNSSSLKSFWDSLSAKCRNVQVSTHFESMTPERATISVQDSEQVNETYQEQVPTTVNYTESVPYQQQYTQKVQYEEQYTVPVVFQVPYTIQIPYKKRAGGIRGVFGGRNTRHHTETRYRAETRHEARTRLKERDETRYRTAYKNVTRVKTVYHSENRVRKVMKKVTRFCIDHNSVAKAVRSSASVSVEGIDDEIDKMMSKVVGEISSAQTKNVNVEKRVEDIVNCVERLESLSEEGRQLKND